MVNTRKGKSKTGKKRNVGRGFATGPSSMALEREYGTARMLRPTSTASERIGRDPIQGFIPA